MSDPFADALVQFIRAFRMTFHCTAVHMVVHIAEDEEHPMQFPVREIDRAICRQALNPPPEGPATK